MASAPLPRLVAGHYELRRLISEGGQGRTYDAVDTRTGRRAAVKVLALGEVKQWKELDLFRREGRVLGGLEHAGIPRFLDEARSDDGTEAYLVMEFVEGETLRARVEASGPLRENELWSVLWQAAAILEYLHARRPPIVHRDIKPANLMMRPDGKLVLVDFGVVQHEAPVAGVDRTFVGTWGFMAPEQFHGEASPATDVFALGATLLSLACGRPPEELPHEDGGLRFKLDDISLPDALRDVIRAMTEPEPARRPRDGAELVALLQARTAAAPAQPAPEAEADGLPALQADGLPPPMRLATGVLLSVVGMLGFVGLTVLRVVLLPFIFMVLRGVGKTRLTAERERAILDAVGAGARGFQQLARGGFEEAKQGQRALEAEGRAEQGGRRLPPGVRQRQVEEAWRKDEERRRAAAAARARTQTRGRR
ncbi:MAG: serine/threonine protein kinase [Deltaproteobacteria bacterium]|nr:serine/threonine protein kinase [Deltaproteobacteria bacterium]